MGILQRCKHENNRLNLLHLYGHIVRIGLEINVALGNCLFQRLIGLGHIYDAQHLFNQLAYRDEHSWNALIAGHIKNGDPQKAFSLYEEMQKDEFVCTNGHTYVALLKSCGISKDLKRGLAMHDTVAKSGLLETDAFIGNSLIDMYVKCGSLEKAQQVFDVLPSRDVVGWTALLAGYSEHGRGTEALLCFKRMQAEGVSPSSITILCSLKACASMGTINKGEEIHTEVEENALYASNTTVWNTLLDMYIKCGSLSKARILFDKLEVHNVVSWTVLISGYSDNGYSEGALKYCERMQQQGILPDVFTFACTLKCCGNAGVVNKGKQLHSLIGVMGLDKDPFVWNSLIDMYAKNGLCGKVHEIFYKIQVPNVVSWTILISSFVEGGMEDQALQSSEQMQLEGVIPNITTYSWIIKACGQMGDVDTIIRMHSKADWMGILDKDIAVINTLLDSYIKSSSLVLAQKVFERTQIQDVVLWTTLIAGYIEYGHSKQALKFLEQMKIEGLSPDIVMFIFSLKAFAYLGDLNNIEELEMEMVKKGLEREDTLVITLVETYAKCGALVEAQGIFETFSFLGASTWNALIGGYSEHGESDKALECYEKMTRFGVAYDCHTLIYSLKACSEIGYVDKGREIHADIEKTGFFENSATGNALIDFYGQCGFIDIAQKIFYELPFKDVVSWNTLITAYADYGYATEAYACLRKMQIHCITPNAITFISILKVCGNRGLIETVKEIHGEIERNRDLEDLLLGNTLVDVYAKYGLLAKAKQVFDQLPELNVVSWTSLIAGYVEHEHAEEALKCFQQMQLNGVSPNSVTYVSLLRSCADLGALREGQGMHVDVVKRGLLERNISVANALVNMYGKCGCLSSAHSVFEKLLARNIGSWTTLISAYVECRHGEGALKCFERMRQDGVSPDASTFTYLLRACGILRESHKGQEIHADMEKMGLQVQAHVSTIDMYAKCGLIANVEHLFSQLPVKDITAWNALIAGYAEHGHADKALISLGLMQLEGISPNTLTIVCCLKACCNKQDIQCGQILHAQIEGEGLMEEDLVGNSLIEMYASGGAFADARQVFNKLPDRDVVSWTALFSSYTDHGFVKEALKCFGQMQNKGVSPDFVTFICTLKACGEIGAKDRALEVHSEIEKKGVFQQELTVSNTLVNVYAKCGLNAETHKVFDCLVIRDIVSWNALMAGYVKLGNSAYVFQSFDKLLEQGLKPDLVTFLIILTACSHFSLFNESQRYLECMNKNYGIAPTVDHLTGMVDLLCRSGQLDIAMEMIRRMPMHPNLVVLRSVLNMCRWWGNADLGNQVFQNVVCTNSTS